MVTAVSVKDVAARLAINAVAPSPPEVVPRKTLYVVAPALVAQLRVTWPVPATAVRLAGACGAAGLMVINNVAEPVPLELEAVMVTLLVPAVVGVPVMRPAALRLNPAGSPVAPKDGGFWLPVIW